MDRLVDHLFVFEGNGVIADFPGNYSQYRDWLKDKEQLPATNLQLPVKTDAAYGTGNKEPATGNLKKASFKEKREFELLEKEIADLNKEKELINSKLSSNSTSFEELQKLSLRIGQLTQILDEKELRWLELSEIS